MDQQHRFSIGDNVIPAPNKLDPFKRQSVYVVIRRLPPADHNRRAQYRVKCALDNYERILDDAELRPA